MFNLVDIYGDCQLDPTRQEYILCYVAGELARDRKARRSATFRQRGGEKKDAGDDLVKHAWNKAQLMSLANSCSTRGNSFTRAGITEIIPEALSRVKSQLQKRVVRFKDRLDGEYTVGRILEESECSDGECEYLVVWAGYEHPDEHTWEPKEVVEDTEALENWETRASSIRQRTVAR